MPHPEAEPHLDVLRACAVLDTPPEPEFDEITRRAAAICETPVAAICFVDRQRCFLKSAVGLAGSEVARDAGFCGYAFQSSGTFIVEDALAHPRFRNVPMVTMPGGFRFYTGVPLRLREGTSVGTLCVLDRHPRQLNTDQIIALQQLAGSAVALLEKRRAQRARPSGGGGRGCVLIVDDHADVREFCAMVIRRAGLVALQAFNGIEALRMLEEYKDDVRFVLSDVQMPGMDGLEFARRLRDRADAPPIVMMSAFNTPELRGTLAGLGVDRLIQKPFSVQELQEVINERMGARVV
jgi:CheY-like chemotaxis protein